MNASTQLLFGGEVVLVERHGVGVCVDRSYRPDGWDGEDLLLVLLPGKRGRVAAASFRPSSVTAAPIDTIVPQLLIDGAMQFMEERGARMAARRG